MKLIFTILFTLNLLSPTCANEANAPKKVYLSWEKFHKDSAILAEKVKDQGPFDGVVAIARGGYIPAVIIAHKLGIKHVVSFSIASYDDTEKKQGDFDVYGEFKDLKGRWLVIDELVDSGKTLEKIRAYLPKSVFGVVYAKPEGAKATDFYAQTMEQTTWLVFPWE